MKKTYPLENLKFRQTAAGVKTNCSPLHTFRIQIPKPSGVRPFTERKLSVDLKRAKQQQYDEKKRMFIKGKHLYLKKFEDEQILKAISVQRGKMLLKTFFAIITVNKFITIIRSVFEENHRKQLIRLKCVLMAGKIEWAVIRYLKRFPKRFIQQRAQ